MADLIGPLPKMPATPKHPTPWRRNGNEVVDANGQMVPLRAWDGFDNQHEMHRLIQEVIDAVNEKHGCGQ